MSIAQELGFDHHQLSRTERDQDLAALIRDDLSLIHQSWADLTEVVRGIFGSGASLDEMALIFPGDAELLQYLRYAVRVPGYELFNTAYDHVQVEPVRTSYDTNYWFMRAPAGYRLELMVMNGGYSPLHMLLADQAVQREEPPYRATVHASFKCVDEEAYAIATHGLRDAGYESVQRCTSTYGRFSYWSRVDAGSVQPAWLLKPRVNLRDVRGVKA